jgi:hypothetical protein
LTGVKDIRCHPVFDGAFSGGHRALDTRMRQAMTEATNGTRQPPHGLFFMENAGGHHAGPAEPAAAMERQPSCFALEEEKGGGWNGSGASGPLVKESRPTL